MLLLAGAVGYGFMTLKHAPFADGPKVAAIQATIPQSDKMADIGGLFEKYDDLCSRAAASGVDLVVWPETCYPYGWWTIDPKVPPASVPKAMADNEKAQRAALKFFITGKAEGFVPKPGMVVPKWNTNILLGTNGNEWDGRRTVPSNTALLMNADGDAVGRYDKMHLVPFGEYVPFRETLPWLQNFTPYTDDYSCRPGTTYTRFPLKARDRTFTFGCLICYEDSDPYLARQYATADRPVDFLVNISNDGWFDGTEEHEQHLAICRFRAIEARRSVVRAVNMGISAVIDPDGRVIALPGESWSKSVKMDGIVTATVPLDRRVSLYARFGDWVPAACWVLLTIGHFAGVLQRRRAKAVPT